MAAGSDLIRRLISGDRLALARAISSVENEDEIAETLSDQISGKIGNAYRVGITGPPGAGKSTLASKLASMLNERGKKVGIIAVDPTSPFTGGALLGDRVRMMELGLRDGVFVRSMATRGSLGGLSKTTQRAADLLDAAGYQIILLETVGVGQAELDVAEASDTTIVVLTPESGDAVQAMKAGLMEIADLFVLNKSDRPGAEQSYSALLNVLQINRVTGSSDRSKDLWSPIILKTVASQNRGIEEVIGGVEKHRDSMLSADRLVQKRKARLRKSIMQLVEERRRAIFWTNDRRARLEGGLELVLKNKISSLQFVEKLIKE